MAVLALLMAGTSWAVASWVSIWLVPPYLILMALLLFPPAARPQGDPVEAGSDESNHLQPARPGEDLDDSDPPPEGSEPGAASSPPRARRGKGRAKKVKPVPEPAEATWVQVAPGKFVRVEAPETSGQAGPHAPVGIPVEVPATPQGPSDGQEDNPIGGVESEPSSSLEGGETAGSPGIVEAGTSSADGNAPQDEGPFEEAEASQPEAALEVDHDRAEAEPAGEGMEDEGEQSPSSEDLEPTETLALALALADVPPEDTDDRGATSGGTDPTEIPVDETDLDDAGPSHVVPQEFEAPADADSFETEVLSPPSEGSPWWPRRLAPRANTRVGHPPRATGREASPRNLARSLQAARHPQDPRRLTRRGARRPRQITRTLPPRSPPCRKPVGGRRDLEKSRG